MTDLDTATRTELEAAAFRALRAHLRVGCYGVAHVVDGPLALVRVPQQAEHSLWAQTVRLRLRG